MTTERRRGVRFVDRDGETHYVEMNPLEHPSYNLLRFPPTPQPFNNRHLAVASRCLAVTYRRELWFVPEGPLVSPTPYAWPDPCSKLIAPSVYGVSIVPEPCVRRYGHAGRCSTTHDRYIDVVYREEP